MHSCYLRAVFDAVICVVEKFTFFFFFALPNVDNANYLICSFDGWTYFGFQVKLCLCELCFNGY